MGATNQSLIEKADLVVADMVSGGGYLVPEQAKQFYEIMIKESQFMKLCTTKPMKGDRYEQDKTAFLGQVLVPANEGAAISEEDRSKPDFQKVTLQTKEYIAETRFTYTDLEDNIEGDGLADKVKSLIAKAVARDIERVVIQGDTTLVANTRLNRLLKQKDGVLKQATSHVVAAGGVRLSKSVFESMYRAIPAEFVNENMAFITSKNGAFDYAATVANRMTSLGDQTLTQRMKAADFMGMPVVPIALWPENLNSLGGSNETNVLMMDPKNVIVGIQREIRVETDKDIRAREWIVVTTIRFDFTYIHEPAIVLATGVIAA